MLAQAQLELGQLLEAAGSVSAGLHLSPDDRVLVNLRDRIELAIINPDDRSRPVEDAVNALCDCRSAAELEAAIERYPIMIHPSFIQSLDILLVRDDSPINREALAQRKLLLLERGAAFRWRRDRE